MTNQSLKLLELFSKRETISLNDLGAIYNNDPEAWCHPIAYLRNEGFLEIDPTYISLMGDRFTFNAPFKLTYKGQTALEDEIKSRRHINFNEFRAWFTLAIALAALIKSFFF
nr:hypothetical protein [uncultured Schaedlerella sp.]